MTVDLSRRKSRSVRARRSPSSNNGQRRKLLLEALEERRLLAVTDPFGDEFQVNLDSAWGQRNPSVAGNALGNYVVAYESELVRGIGNVADVVVQRFDALGNPIGAVQRVNQSQVGSQIWPEVALANDGSFIVTWTGNDGEATGVFARRYGSDGQPLGDAFVVNTTTADRQEDSSISMDRDSGEFVIVWHSLNQDGSEWGVFGQRFDAAGAKVGPEFQVNEFTNSTQSTPSVAMDTSGSFVVAWQSFTQDGDGYGVFAQRFDSAGVKIDVEFQVAQTTASYQWFPELAMDAAGNFIVTWSSYQDASDQGVYARRFASDGTPLGDEFQVNTHEHSTQNVSQVTVAENGDFVIAWQSYAQDGSVHGVYAQRYTADGSALGGEFALHTNTSNEQSAVSLALGMGGALLAAWTSNHTGEDNVVAQFYADAPALPDLVPTVVTGPQGAFPGQTIEVSSRIRNQGAAAGPFALRYYLSADPIITADDYAFGATLHVDGLTAGAYYDDARSLLIPPGAPTGALYIGVLLDLDEAVAEADEANNGAPTLAPRPIDVRPVVLYGEETRLSRSSDYTQSTARIGVDGAGNYVAVWESDEVEGIGIYDIFVQRFNAFGTPLGPERLVTTQWQGHQHNPDVAVASDGSFVVTWTGSDANSTGIFAQRFDTAGNPAGARLAVNTVTANRQENANIAIDRDSGQFVVTWDSLAQDGSDWGVYAQRFNADGTKAGSEFRVNNYTESTQVHNAVAMSPSGEFWIAFTSWQQDGQQYSVFLQRYSPAGVELGAEILVNTYTNSYQWEPAIAMDAAGNATVVWGSYHQDGSNQGIYGQRFTAAGERVGGEFRISTEPGDEQQTPAIAMDADGNFAVAWQSHQQDGSSWGIYVQRYRADGTPLGGELRANDTVPGAQVSASIALSAQGLAVAWHDTTTSDVHWQLYDTAPGAPELVPVGVTAPRGASPGQIVHIASEIANQGAAAAAFSLTYYLSTDPIITAADTPLQVIVPVDGLVASGSFVDNRQVQIPVGTAPGIYYIGLLVDSDSEVAEGSETNNGTATDSFASIDVRPLPAYMGSEQRVTSHVPGTQTQIQLDANASGQTVAVWMGANRDGFGTYEIYLQRYNEFGTPVGHQQQVNENWEGEQTGPAVAIANDGSFIVTWHESDGSGNGIRARRFAANGSPIGPSFQVNSTTLDSQEYPSIGIDRDSREFVITWHSHAQDGSSWGIFGQLFAADGTPVAGEIPINQVTSGEQSSSRVVMDNSGKFIVTWLTGNDGSGYSVAARRFAADGGPVADEFRVNTFAWSTQYYPDIAQDAAGNFTIVWESYGRDGSEYGVYGQRYNAAGVPLGTEFRISTNISSNQHNADIAMDAAGNAVVAWQSATGDGSSHGIFAQRLRPDGTFDGGEFLVNVTTLHDQLAPSVAVGASGRYLFTWEGYGPEVDYDVWLRMIGAGTATPDLVVEDVTSQVGVSVGQALALSSNVRNQGGAAAGSFRIQYYLSADAVIDASDTPLGAPVQIDGLAAYETRHDTRSIVMPAAAAGQYFIGILIDTQNVVAEANEANNSYVPSFNEAQLAVAAFPQLGPERRANNHTANRQETPAAGFDSAGNYVVVWKSLGQDGSNFGVYGQRFAADGSKLGGEFRVNGTTAGAQSEPAIAVAADGSYVVSWTSADQDGSGDGVYARRYAADGTALGGEFRVNNFTSGNQSQSAIALGADGRFIIVWRSHGQDSGGNGGIYAKIYSADGATLLDEFWAGSNGDPDQHRPHVAMNASGRFVISWDDADNVYARRFLASGSAVGDEFLVNSFTGNQQYGSSVGIADSGDFTIAWESWHQDGSVSGVYAQRYSALGAKLGGEFRVNTHTDWYQHDVALAMTGAGDFAIAWNSYLQDDAGTWGVYAQRYSADGRAYGGEFRVNTFVPTSQYYPSIDLLSLDRLLIAWESDGAQDGDATGIYVQSTGLTAENSRPNLVGSFLSHPGNVNLNQSLTLNYTIVNAGPLATPATTARLWLSDDNVFGNADDVDTGITVDLPAILHDNGRNAHSGSVQFTWPNADPFGTDRVYSFALVADSGLAVLETSEADNAALTGGFNLLMPDLVGSVSVPSNVNPGGALNITVRTNNQGNAPSAASTAHVWLSDDNIIGNADDIDLLIDVEVPSLVAFSTSHIATINYTWPAIDQYLTDDLYFFYVKYDVTAAVVESNEANNQAVSNQLRINRPNLVVTSLSAPSSVAPGESVNIPFTVRNHGTLPAAATTVKLFLSDDSLTGGDIDLNVTVNVPALPVYGSPNFTQFNGIASFAWPLVDPINTDQRYHLVAIADPGNVQRESNEVDNATVSSQVQLRVPDLAAGLISTVSTVQAGQSLRVRMEVQNLGLAATPATTARITLSDNEIAGDSDDRQLSPLLNVAVPPLAGNASTTLEFVVPWPPVDPFATDGEYHVVAALDPANAIEEPRENNNVSISGPIALVTPVELDFELVGHIGSGSRAVALAGNIAYELSSAGLRVLNIADPAHIQRLNEIVFPVDAQASISVQGSSLFVVNGEELRVFDISTPHLPNLLAAIEMDWESDFAVTFDAARMYVGNTDENQLEIWSLATPQFPQLVQEYALRGQPYSIAIENSRAFVVYFDPVFGKDAVEVVNVAAAPSFVSRRSLNEPATETIASTPTLLAVSIGDGVQLIDISNPALPRVRGIYELGQGSGGSSFVTSLALAEDTLQVLVSNFNQFGHKQFLFTVDVSDLADPAELSSLDLGYPGGGALVDIGDQAIVASRELFVIDTADRFAPEILGSYAEPVGVTDVALHGQLAALAAGNVLQLVDVSQPASPLVVGQFTAQRNIDRVLSSGQYVVLVTGLGQSAAQLEVINVANPAVPFSAGVYEVGDSTVLLDVASASHVLYVLTGQSQFGGVGELAILDITAPTDIVVESQTEVFLDAAPTGNLFRRLSLDGDNLAVAHMTQVDAEPNDLRTEAIDLGNLAAPLAVSGLVGSFANGDLHDWYQFSAEAGDEVQIQLVGDSFYYGEIYLYDGDGNYLTDNYYYYGDEGGLIWNVAVTGTYFVRIHHYDTSFTGFTYQLGLAKNAALPELTGASGGIAVFDVSDPAAPEVTAHIPVNSDFSGFALRGTHVYVAEATPPEFSIWSFAGAPVKVSSAQIESAGLVSVSGNLAFVGSNDRLEAIDIGDPLRPVALGSFATGLGVTGIASSGVLQFLAADSLYVLSAQLEGVEAPDLVTTAVSAPSSGELGRPTKFAWTVRNGGRAAAPGNWVDRVYLSTDAAFGGDILLGEVEHTGPLAALTSYSAELISDLAGVAPGTYYVIVRTDAADEVNELFIESNNTRVSSLPIVIGVSDLSVTNIQVPAVVQRGDALPVNWIVFNSSFTATTRSWEDEVYLSLDDQFDPDTDLHVGTMGRAGGLAARTVYSFGVDVDTSALPEGQYYVFVRTDAHNTVPEAAGEANNLLRSTTPVRVGIPVLTLGQATTETFSARGQSKYFRVDTTAGQNLAVQLDDLNNQGFNELYIKFGFPPTRSSYDARYGVNFAPDQVLQVLETRGGSYYILAYADSAPDAPAANFSIMASTVDFQILGASPQTVGNVGEVTLSIRAGALPENATAVLVAPDGTRYVAIRQYRAAGDNLYPTFNLNGAAVGAYDIRLEAGSLFTQVNDFLQVQTGQGANFVANLVLPSAVRVNAIYTVWVEYANTGDTDMPAPILFLDADHDAQLTLAGQAPVPSHLALFAGSATGDAAVLRAGATGRIAVQARAVRGRMNFDLTSLIGSTNLINWNAYKESARRDAIPEAQWNALWPQIIDGVGDTWADYAATIRENATRFGRQGFLTHSVSELFGAEIDQALGLGVSAIGGVLRHAENNAVLSGVSITARKVVASDDDRQLATGLTDQNGQFYVRNLSPGTYELFVEGYRFETPPSFIVTAATDVLNVEVFAQSLPEAPAPTIVPDSESDPVMMVGDDGTPHMVWRRGQHIWHAYYAAGAWKSAQIPEVAGFDPTIQAASNLLDGADGGVVITYRTENAPDGAAAAHSDLYHVVGRLNAAGTKYEWSSPTLLAGGATDETAAALAVLPNGQLALVFQRSSATTTDDTDLYYEFVALESSDFVFGANPSQAAVGAEIIRGQSAADSEFGISFTHKSPTFNVPYGIPILRGEYGESLSVQVSGSKGCGQASASGGITGTLQAGDMVSANGGGSFSASWKVEGQDECSDGHYVFNQASASANIEVNAQVPAFVWSVGIAQLEIGSLITGNASGSATWTAANFPGKPDGGQAQVNLAAGPYGRAELNIPLLGKTEIRIGGQGGLRGTMDMATEAVNWQVTVRLFGEGTFRDTVGVSWSKTWCAPGDCAIADDELVYTLNTALGTPAVYPGNPVLADVSQSVSSDGKPALARGPAGELMLASTRETATPGTWVGNEVVVSTWTGAAWSAPATVPGSRGFNADVQLAYDSLGIPFAVWTTADNSGFNSSSNVDAVLGALENSRIVYSRFVGGAWTTPAQVSDTAGAERDLFLSRTADGKLIASWLSGSENADSLYTSIFDAGAWGAAQQVTIADVTSAPTLAAVGGETTLVWTQEVGTSANPHQRLVQSKLNASTGQWSTPEFLVIAAEPPAGDPTPTAMYYSWAAAAPPDGVPETSVKYYFDTATLPGALSPADASQRIRDAAAIYSASSTALELVEVLDPAQADIYVGFADDSGCGGFDAGVLACSEYAVAAASSGAYANGAELHRFISNAAAGEILQRVTFINDWQWHVDASATVPADKYDLWTVAMHEFGHMLGLTGHSRDPQSPVYPTVRSALAKRSLTAADTAAIGYLYAGIGAPPSSTLVDPFGDLADDLPALGPGAVPEDCVDEAEDCCDDEDPDPDEDEEEEEDDDDSDGVASFDPNDKVGPAGAGVEHYIQPGEFMPFSIFYENDPEFATAPAQIVRVEDQLSPSFDWTTFELGDINLFGSYVIDVPAGLSHYETTVDLRPEGLPILARVTAGIDIATGKLEWLFESLDPDTLAAPDNPLIGFLAVNNKELHNGEGHFEYFIRARSDLATGVVFTNQAFNYFDDNEPVPTPITSHKIDAGRPTSTITALPALSPDEPLLVSWSGQDDANGSGVATYTIYVSDNGGPWQHWLSDTPLTSSVWNGIAGHQYAFRSVARDAVGHEELDPGTAEATTTLDFTELRVDAIEVGAAAITAQFKRALKTSVLNLYDGQAGTYGAADVTLVGATVGNVAGSLLVTNGGKTLSFLKTGGPLVPDTYTLTMRSGANALQDSDGNLLDGNGDDLPGGDYVQTFVVAATSARTVSLPDFTRGPGQGVNVPAAQTGLPLSIDHALGVLSIDFVLEYNPALLNVTGLNRAAGLPGDWAVAVNLATPGRVIGTAYGATPLSTGALTFAHLVADIPATATYADAARLRLTDLQLNDGAILAQADDALQVVGYFGDATANHDYSGFDASQIARVAVGLDTGFANYRMKDPAVIADVSGNGLLGALDASFVARRSVGLAQPEVPALPGVLPPIILGGPDPTVRVATITSAQPNSNVAVPLRVTDTSSGLQALDLNVAFDAQHFTVVDVRTTGLASTWSVVWNLDPAGRVYISSWGIEPLTGSTGDVLEIVYFVSPTAPNGATSALDLGGLLNEGGLALTPIDGSLTVQADANDPPQAFAQNLAAVEDTQLAIILTGDDGDAGAAQTLTFAITQQPAHGTLVSFNPATGAVTYIPASNYHGPDSFRFKVTDDASLGGGPLTSADATISLNVAARNDQPSGGAQTVTVRQGETINIQLTGADNDPEVAQTLTFAIATTPQHGQIISFNPATGAVTYRADAGYEGSDVFTFTVTDDATAGGPARTSDPRTIGITINNPARRWQNSRNALDVDDDGFVSAVDAVLIINYLNGVGGGAVPGLPAAPPPYYDVDGNDFIVPLDAVLVINYLNGRGSGEAPHASESPAAPRPSHSPPLSAPARALDSSAQPADAWYEAWRQLESQESAAGWLTVDPEERIPLTGGRLKRRPTEDSNWFDAMFRR